jgi:hypothetical protein
MRTIMRNGYEFLEKMKTSHFFSIRHLGRYLCCFYGTFTFFICKTHHAWPIKFHTAAKPGVKRKCDNDAQNKNNEKYEANRKRLFLSSWDTDRHWLQNDLCFIKSWTFLNFNSRYFLVCFLRAMTVLWAVYCDSITLTASICTLDFSWSDTVLIL